MFILFLHKIILGLIDLDDAQEKRRGGRGKKGLSTSLQLFCIAKLYHTYRKRLKI